MQLEHYNWVSQELLDQARPFVAEMEKEVARSGRVNYYFFPLNERMENGLYWLNAAVPHIFLTLSDVGKIEYHYIRAVKDPAFDTFIQRAITLAEDITSFLTGIVIYALAHGYDLVKQEKDSQNGQSLFTSFPHSALYGSDFNGYE